MCSKQFKTRQSLKNHQFFHLPGENHPYMCDLCGKKCNSKSNLNRHKRSHKEGNILSNVLASSQSKDYTCEISKKQFQGDRSLKKLKFVNSPDHERSSDLQGKNEQQDKKRCSQSTCKICNEKFQNNIQLSNHTSEQHKDIVVSDDNAEFKCGQCNKVYASKESVRKHFIAYHLPEENHPFRCEMCGAKFGDRTHLTRHQFSHEKTRDQLASLIGKCSTCGKYFESKASLRKHESTHCNEVDNAQTSSVENGATMDQLFSCEECGAQFSEEQYYKRHIEGHRKLEESLNPVCKLCNITFKKKATLLHHERKVHFSGNIDDHPYKCNVCNALFGNSHHLKRHQVKHSDLNAYLCSNCGKSFKSKESMKKHEIMFHQSNDNYPHECQVCRHRFGSRSNLLRHMLKHTGEKPHLCSECGRSFKEKKSLLYHQQKVHKSEESERYKCDVCSSRFNSEWSLERHKLIHITLPEYKCDVCNTSFKSLEELTEHYSETHPAVSKMFFKVSFWSSKYLV